MDNKKATGEDGITGKIYKHAFNIFPKSITAMYNRCLTLEVFPKIWKTAKILPITKPGKQNSVYASKYRPISLLNIGGKVLEKSLINSINHHIYFTKYLKPQSIRLHPTKQHRRCNNGSHRICTGGISKRGNNFHSKFGR
jgi:hypothetical protein